MRLLRLMKAEREMHVEDDFIGGQQTNCFVEMEREEREIERKMREKQMMKPDGAESQQAITLKFDPLFCHRLDLRRASGARPHLEVFRTSRREAQSYAEREVEVYGGADPPAAENLVRGVEAGFRKSA